MRVTSATVAYELVYVLDNDTVKWFVWCVAVNMRSFSPGGVAARATAGPGRLGCWYDGRQGVDS